MQADYGYTHDPDGYLLLKITQLIELLGIRHCVPLACVPGGLSGGKGGGNGKRDTSSDPNRITQVQANGKPCISP